VTGTLTVVGNYRNSKHWLLIILSEFQYYSGDIRDSPIVDDNAQLLGFVGAGWVF
jgi:outer membrane scaffolding protein for murein synthesis (MipA/OmpV family)